MNKFSNMTVDEAMEYCEAHEDEFIKGYGKGGKRAFDCLISILETKVIKPEQLPEYGME